MFELDDALNKIERDGYSLVPAVFTPVEVDAVTSGLSAALEAARGEGESIKAAAGTVYAARNVLAVFPAARELWRRPPLVELLTSALGPGFGLVRGLFFDKPPDRGWTLPWHKDMTIAVLNNRLPSGRFGKPTVKAGVPHVEAPLDVLENMLTLRIHLDDVTHENGPLRVIPGSHRTGRELSLDAASQEVFAARGDVLAIRPLVTHASAAPLAGTTRHRRVLHLEFAGNRELGDGYAWHEWF